MNNQKLLELRTVEMKNWVVTVSYPREACPKDIAWTHLEHHYPEQVPTRQELKLRYKQYNPWRKSHSATHWCWYAKIARPEPLRGQHIMPVYADSCYTHKGGCLLIAMNNPSRKLNITFTPKPAVLIGFGDPKLVPGLFYD